MNLSEEKAKNIMTWLDMLEKFIIKPHTSLESLLIEYDLDVSGK